ncbi:hypothetical protein NDU88_002535 [Pleurodeles waltl]|uniref:Uncharacterized protein n=1 Tax=Pleurodeles waltl TaxID=8319 RepID=A0AAV7U9Z7_PLEWA|nr:hypothetical protein NDU88_002535 [Pleurodeles waltl]
MGNPSWACRIVEERQATDPPYSTLSGRGVRSGERPFPNRGAIPQPQPRKDQELNSVRVVNHQMVKTHRLGRTIAVGQHLEVMDLKIPDEHLTNVEDHIGMLPEHGAELLTLRDKLTNLEDRSRRDNVRFFRIPEQKEGTDIKAFLQSLLPALTGLTFSPPLKFQRVHRVGPPRSISSGWPRPIIVCFLQHEQAWQVLLKAWSQGPFPLEDQEVRVAVDFSRITNEKRKAFLVLRP